MASLFIGLQTLLNGGSPLAVLRTRQKRLGVEALAEGLTWLEKALFLATNLPYLAISLVLMSRFGPKCLALCGCVPLHSAWAAIIAVVSTIFHAAQVRFTCCGRGGHHDNGPYPFDRLVKLLLCDVSCAASYAVFLSACSGLWASLRMAWPLLLLIASVLLRASGSPRGYAVMHGVWHLASAWVILWVAWPLAELQTSPDVAFGLLEVPPKEMEGDHCQGIKGTT
eukprot:CAMPEP_0203867940 /NCGR_PEP_ID=MMETSP0359-20131031/16821_1 /ASSEMBLY_ACC=CAM_ASM_000338 /TAXON_ID=268821 /ORGANISM="Scrippsiella Hangoei, Strain SHTV-5" /LENGTH=224 /DNA_ID=CAMNT_0050786277 /DNA_START=27 /DNA_END=697 /DNA_ORIENTATION=+